MWRNRGVKTDAMSIKEVRNFTQTLRRGLGIKDRLLTSKKKAVKINNDKIQ